MTEPAPLAEAEAIVAEKRRRLAGEGEPHRGELAKALLELSRALQHADRDEDALAAAEESVRVLAPAFLAKPAWFSVPMRAGLGWIGRHTNLVSRRFGSWLFLGEVFTDMELPPDTAEVDHCGSCDACRRACPTDALAEPYRIDPRRCISYLTIEHGGAIAPDLAARFGNRIYGCDDCLAACPWNKFASPALTEQLKPRADLAAPRLSSLHALDDAEFRRRFAGTAIRRIGIDRLHRNVAIALANAASGRARSTRGDAPA